MFHPTSFPRTAGSADLAVRLMAKAARGLPAPSNATKTLGLIGFDAEAQELALRAHHGFGMTILIHDAAPVPQALLDQTGAVQVSDLSGILPLCDVVSLHAMAQPAMTGARLDQMKPDALLINATDRGLVDENALAQSLMFETLAGAALAVVPGHDLHPMLAQCDTLVTLDAPGLDPAYTSRPRVA